MVLAYASLIQQLASDSPKVTSVRLYEFQNLREEDVCEVLSLLRYHTHCRNLSTHYPHQQTFRENEMQALADVISENKSLKKIEVLGERSSRFQYSVEQFKQISQALATNSTLKQFYWPQLNDQSIAEFSHALATNHALTHIDIFCESISGDSVTLLADAIAKNNSLQVIDFTRTALGDDGLIKIMKAVSVHKKLRKLVFDKCGVGDAGATAFADCLRDHKTLRDVSFSWNTIGNDGIVAIAEALKHNNKLQKLQFLNNSFTKEACLALKEACQVNTSIKEIRPRVQLGIQIQEKIKRHLP